MNETDFKIKHLVVGAGEVGQAIKGALSENHDNEVFITDIGFNKIEWHLNNQLDYIHICFGWNYDFNTYIKQWKLCHDEALVIVHSTVPIGTCDALDVVHSPVSGKHPNLHKSIKVFPKWFGGKQARKAATVFNSLGCFTREYASARTTEAMKIWATTMYGLEIMIEKDIHAWCKEHAVPFSEVYTIATEDYNKGYKALKDTKYVRPVLSHISGPIGGHCVIPNLAFLKDSRLARLLKKANDMWHKESSVLTTK